jgi:hypothetical protein
MNVLKMTAEQLTKLFESDATEQLEIALAENGLSTDHPTWEEVFIELNSVDTSLCNGLIDEDFSG